jgi:hypothetical protein
MLLERFRCKPSEWLNALLVNQMGLHLSIGYLYLACLAVVGLDSFPGACVSWVLACGRQGEVNCLAKTVADGGLLLELFRRKTSEWYKRLWG